MKKPAPVRPLKLRPSRLRPLRQWGLVSLAAAVTVPIVALLHHTHQEVTAFRHTLVCPLPQPTAQDTSGECRQLMAGKIRKLGWNGQSDYPRDPYIESRVRNGQTLTAKLPNTKEGREFWKTLNTTDESQVSLLLWRGKVVEVLLPDHTIQTIDNPEHQEQRKYWSILAIVAAGATVWLFIEAEDALATAQKVLRRRRPSSPLGY